MQVYNNNDGSTGKISTSKGNQIKLEAGGIWYKADYLGYEGAAEFLCSKILEYSNVDDYVDYDLCTMTINGQKYNACQSYNFLEEGTEIITADRLFKNAVTSEFPAVLDKMSLKDRIEYFVENVEKYTKIPDFGKELTKMLEFDQLTLNDDRHFNNIAFIRDENDNYEMTPLFDNGGAFLSDIRTSYPLEKSIYGLIHDVQGKPFSPDFDKQVDVLHAMYGQQLEIDNSFHFKEEDLQKLRKQYGEKVFSRVNDIWKQQQYRYPEYFREPEISIPEPYQDDER